MKGKAVLAVMLTLLFIGMLTLAFEVQLVKAGGTIYIRADGSIEGTIDISTIDNVTYTFTDNIFNQSIIVEKDNIVVDGAGYTLQGTWAYAIVGILLNGRSNVTIKNTNINNFYGGLWLGYSSNNTIHGNNITNNSEYGIALGWSSNNTISGNNLTNNSDGVFLDFSSHNNTISGNTISSNSYSGIYTHCSYNKFYHNNFIDNSEQVISFAMNVWDDGYPSGGNYWSDYIGVDVKSGLFQNETGSDGIGDTSYTIDQDNQDNCPLMGMFSEFNGTSEHRVQTICNSLISDFQFNGTAISFNVSGENGTTGFCRICIPRALMNETYKVFVNGTEVPCNLLPCSNTTHSYLYFTYDLSTQEIIVIPEFPSFMMLPLFMITTLLAVIVYRKNSPCNIRYSLEQTIKERVYSF